MAAQDSLEADSLIKQVQSLPPELYNAIYDLTFTVDLDSTLTPEHLNPYHKPEFKRTFYIDKSWRPPTPIQVNRKQRDQLSSAFYEGAIFVFKDDLTDPDNLSLLTRWLKSLSTEHLSMVSRSQLRILTKSKIKFRPNNLIYRIWFRHVLGPIDVDTVVGFTRRVYKAINAAGVPLARVRNIRFRIPLEGRPGEVWDAHANHTIPGSDYPRREDEIFF